MHHAEGDTPARNIGLESPRVSAPEHPGSQAAAIARTEMAKSSMSITTKLGYQIRAFVIRWNHEKLMET